MHNYIFYKYLFCLVIHRKFCLFFLFYTKGILRFIFFFENVLYEIIFRKVEENVAEEPEVAIQHPILEQLGKEQQLGLKNLEDRLQGDIDKLVRLTVNLI